MNVKQDDIAIQIISKSNNHGSIVKVMKFAGVLFYEDGTSRPSWICDFQKRIKYRNGTYSNDTHAIVPDAWLRPVRGLPMNEEIDQEIPEIA